ncbi:MAG: S41 family peptidase [Bacillota bacterium]|nr:S41 family peptidase [Bacillota bacterium]
MPTTTRRIAWGTLAMVLVLSLVSGAVALPGRAAGAAPDELGLLRLCLDYIKSHYPGQWDLGGLVEAAAKGLVSGLGDRHSAYLTAGEYERLITGLSGSFGGLGIYIDEGSDGYVVIIAPIRGTPADLAGLRAGDKIAEIDGRDVRYVGTSEASRMLRGEPGTKVTVGIIRQGVQGMLHFEITRAWIEINPVEFEMLTDGIGYIHLSTFSDQATRRLDQAVAALKAGGARAVVLDLRNNGGGLLDQAIGVAQRFLLPGQTILSVSRKVGGPQVTRAAGEHYMGLPVAVLVNGGTASASEILAGAIRDNGMGVIVGTPTYGKGSIQNIWRFSTGGGLKLTTAAYATPSGRPIEAHGLDPDELVQEADGLPEVPYLQWWRPIRYLRMGLDVLALQEVLIYLGEPPGTADGFYGLDSVRAVQALQSRSGLAATGVVDEQTAAALNRAALDRARAASRDPQLERAIVLLKGAL